MKMIMKIQTYKNYTKTSEEKERRQHCNRNQSRSFTGHLKIIDGCGFCSTS